MYNFKFTILFFLLFFLASCEEHNTSISFKLPEYAPQLIIQSAASPQSGAVAIIQYSRPLYGVDGYIPALPKMKVFLLENGKRIRRFTQDSVGYFSIAPNYLTLKNDVAYSIEILETETGKQYTSSGSILPDQPQINNVEAIIREPKERFFNLILNLGKTSNGPKGLAVQPVIYDRTGIVYQQLALSRYFKEETLHIPDQTLWNEKVINERHDRMVIFNESNGELGTNADIWVAYFSKELVDFVQDIEDIDYFGEEVFMTVKPIYTNINGAVGVFGLYNEAYKETTIKIP